MSTNFQLRQCPVCRWRGWFFRIICPNLMPINFYPFHTALSLHELYSYPMSMLHRYSYPMSMLHCTAIQWACCTGTAIQWACCTGTAIQWACCTGSQESMNKLIFLLNLPNKDISFPSKLKDGTSFHTGSSRTVPLCQIACCNNTCLIVNSLPLLFN